MEMVTTLKPQTDYFLNSTLFSHKEKMKQKRGAVSHVEIVVSFGIFMALLAVIFIFVKPIQEPKLDEVLVDTISQNLNKETETLLKILPLKINSQNSEGIDCFEIPLPGTTWNPQEAFVKDENLHPVEFDISGNNLLVPDTASFIYVYQAEEDLSLNTLSCPTSLELGKNDYILSVPRTQEIISIQKFESLITDYQDNLEQLKEEWGINGNFLITLSYDNGNSQLQLGSQQDPPENLNIHVQEIPTTVFKQGEFLIAKLNIKAWR